MNLDNLLRIINCKHFLKLVILIFSASVVLGVSTYVYFMGDINTSVNIGNDPTQSDTYQITIYDVETMTTYTPPFTIDKTHTLNAGEYVTESYILSNNENIPITVYFTLNQCDPLLNVTFMKGNGVTFTTGYELPAGATNYYFYIKYQVDNSATTGQQLNAQIEITAQAT